MVRVYGDGASLLVDRDHELHITRLMCKYKLSAQIYCSFDNGYIVEYIEGNALTLEQMREPFYSERIARKVAEWHCALTPIPPPALPHPKRGVWGIIQKWLATADQTVPSEQLEVAKREIEETERRLEGAYATTPLVMCHNDLNYGNVLYDAERGGEDGDGDGMAFVDYEYAGFNFRGFDLGNHFNEYGGLDLDFSKYPSRDTRKAFLRHYLKRCRELRQQGGEVELEQEVEQLVVECEDFAQVSHLFWHVWALVIAHTPDKPGDFDYEKYAALRLKEYFVRKPLLSKI